jgi:hypothetical protein
MIWVAYRYQGQAMINSTYTEDFQEGIEAFRAKRPPRFTGR